MAAKDYKAIAAKKIVRPADIHNRPKLLIYSRNKKGKTTFGVSAGVPKTLVIDPEHGTREMKVKNPHVWPVDRWEDMDDVSNYLQYEDHPYEWVVVDGLTKLSNMSLKYVMRLQEERSLDRIPGLVQQRDYGKSGELMKDMLTRFHTMPLGVVYTAQERQDGAYDDNDDDEVDQADVAYVPDLPRGVRGVANSLVDVIGRLYVVKLDSEPPKAERRLWIAESVKYDTGYRSDFVLPDYIRNPTIPKLVTLMRTGKLPVRAAAKKTAVKKP
ncbi:MAG: ATP-binding protein [Actinobacteria bacterium]|nr:ATP-binding protein [Actinomycetota bacterium]MCA1807236.1 ATP-binding protein [Actinomycetota bacterium]